MASAQASAQASDQASEKASEKASAQASDQASVQASAQESAQASAQASDQASVQASDQASAQASDQASAQASDQASNQASAQASDQASAQESAQASDQASAQASDQVSAQASDQASDQASAQESAQASDQASAQASDQASTQASAQASAQASPSEICSLDKHLICTICLDQFVEPVTTTCGHSFCQKCMDHKIEISDRTCPLCKSHQNRTPQVNIVLRDIIKQMKQISEKEKMKQMKDDEYTGAPGEVACDICTERKLKAEKSCLVCLASYCSTHLENHSSTERLKGHKLVEPVENLDERACLQHGRPLELYSRKKERCICVRCMDDSQEEVVATEDEWDNKKAKLENTKTELEQKIKKRKTQVDEINASLQICKKEMEADWWDIEHVFTAVMAIVEKAQAEALQPLKDRRRAVEKDAKDLIDMLEAEINALEKTISDLEKISVLEDHILFLQSYPSLQDVNNIKDWTQVEFDTSLVFGTMRKSTTTMLEQIQQKLEGLTTIELKRVPKFTVDVKLDPKTAHQRLLLSDDGKEVKDGGEDKEVDDSPERFDLFASILGLNKLTSGRSYWEVEVSNKTGWDLGVARGDANRKGKLSLNPDNGYWVTVHYEDEEYAALTAPPVRLSQKDKPEKVGVFVDYEEGLVSFYNVSAQLHIYTFTECSFNDKIFPYFSPHAKKDEKNTDPLIISTVKPCVQDMDMS